MDMSVVSKHEISIHMTVTFLMARRLGCRAYSSMRTENSDTYCLDAYGEKTFGCGVAGGEENWSDLTCLAGGGTLEHLLFLLTQRRHCCL